MRRLTILTVTLIFLALISGCAQGQGVSVIDRAVTEQTPSNTEKALEPETTEQIPPTTTPVLPGVASETPAPEEQSPKPITGAPEESIFNLNYDEEEKYNTFFYEKTSTDLDGDGKKETIKLIPGETKTIDDEQYYKSISLSINSKELEVTPGKDWNLGYDDVSSLFGLILDIDKSDNEKEILIYEEKDVISGDDKLIEKAEIFTYKNGQPQIALGWIPPVQANGTGYVVYTKYSKVLKGGYSIGLQAVKQYSKETGFKEIEMKSYRTITYTSQSGELAVETVKDQTVAKTPGGEKDIPIAKKSIVYFGLYDPLGWIEVFSSDDNKRLGWLDLNKVDIDAYIGYALKASCH